MMTRMMTKMLTSSGARHTHTHTVTLPHKNTQRNNDIHQQPQTFMRKKSSRMRKTLTSGWSQAAERPRPTGGGDPEIFVHVKLSNRELIHSLGISWMGEGEGQKGRKSRGKEE